MSAITTHVLDTARGVPAAGVPVHLERMQDGAWAPVGAGHTDSDGRFKGLLSGSPLVEGHYRISFELVDYHQRHGVQGFFPRAAIEFLVTDPGSHHHVPLLLSPFGYSTYRGS